MKRRCKRPPAPQVTGVARQTPPGARPRRVPRLRTGPADAVRALPARGVRVGCTPSGEGRRRRRSQMDDHRSAGTTESGLQADSSLNLALTKTDAHRYRREFVVQRHACPWEVVNRRPVRAWRVLLDVLRESLCNRRWERDLPDTCPRLWWTDYGARPSRTPTSWQSSMIFRSRNRTRSSVRPKTSPRRIPCRRRAEPPRADDHPLPSPPPVAARSSSAQPASSRSRAA